MKNLLALIFFTACYFSAYPAPPASATETFHVGYTDFKPYIWSEGNSHKGIYVDILQEALERQMGIPVSFHAYPVKRVTNYVQIGKLDGFIEISTPQRLNYSKTGRVPVAVGMVGAFTYKNHPRMADLADLDSLSELKDYRILTYLGDDWAKENLSGFTVDQGAKDLKTALKKLTIKRGDLLLQIEQVAQYNIQQLNLENDLVQLSNIALSPIFYQLHISKKSQFIRILPQLDKTLTAMLNDGSVEGIYKKYRGKVSIKRVVSTKKPKIKFIHYATGVMPDVLNDLADDFNKQQTAFRLKTIHLDMESYKQAIKVMLAGGQPADLLMTWAGYRTQHLVDSGSIEPIEDIWESAKLDERFLSSTSRGMTYNGRKYAVPLTHHIIPMFYNKRIFQENGLEIPRTWDEFLKLGETLKSKGITPIALGSKERWPAQSWFDYLLVRTAGHEYRRRLMTGDASYTDPQVKKVYSLWKNLIDRGFFNENCNNYNYDEASKMVYDGQAAMTLNGTWTIGDFENILGWKAGKDYDIFTFPVIDPNIPVVTVGVMDVILQTKAGKVEAAKDVMDYFSTVESQMKFNEPSGSLAANKNIPSSFYPPLLNKIARIVAATPYEIFSYDLSTPPLVAEVGLTSFKKFLDNPDQYRDLLEKTDKEIKEAFKMK